MLAMQASQRCTLTVVSPRTSASSSAPRAGAIRLKPSTPTSVTFRLSGTAARSGIARLNVQRGRKGCVVRAAAEEEDDAIPPPTNPRVIVVTSGKGG
eukprot:2426597-Pyramimonas_sp.AAC.1